MLPINLLLIIYLIFLSLYIINSKNQKKFIFLILNGAIISIISIFSLNKEIGNFVWLGLILLPLFYHETGLITQKPNKKIYDSEFIQFEKNYFSKVMDFHKKNRANNFYLSEYLHFCYLCFYIFIYGVPLYFYMEHNYRFFNQCTFAILFTLLAGYATHAIIPVYGPRNIFPQITDKRSNGVFFKLVHKVLSKGSTPGTAFPSGHTSSATIVLLITWYLGTPLFYLLLPFGLGLIISTIYGRFHYVSDVVIGIGYAIMAFLLTIAIYD